MDSMRHLSTSLPGASRQRNDEPTSDILGDFKAAALSVTNLYKTAARSQERARGAGYQDALEDLVTFLDKENLGLMDGEGWRVRQWATERLDSERMPVRQGTDASSTMADDEDDRSTAKDEDKDDERSSSPEVQRKPQHHPLANSSSSLTEDDAASQPRRVVSEPPQAQYAPLQGDFTFQSTHAYPSNHDRDMELDNNASTPQHQSTANASNPSSTETVRIIPRSSGRNANRHSKRSNNNAEARLPTLNFNLGNGAGSKRKLPYPDFFDISGINENTDRKDGNGGGNNGNNGRGGKRGRHV